MNSRLRLVPSEFLKVEEFAGGKIVKADTIIKNGIVDSYSDGKKFVMQRPAFNIRDDASVTTTNDIGRGIYFWQETGNIYFVNDDTVYSGGYSLALGVNITSGSDRVYFAEVGGYLVIIDPENNEGWYIHSSATTTLVQITDVDFPPNQTPALQLARGAASLNGTLYVLDTEATIWNSAVEDVTNWTATDFIQAEFENDRGLFIGTHHTDIVVIGGKTTEFFYDNANPIGSPLLPRKDINHRIGGLDLDVYSASQNTLFFVGSTDGGHVSVYMLNEYQLIPIGTNDLNSLLSSAVFVDSMELVTAAFSMGDSVYMVVTTALSGTPKDPQQSFVFTSRFNAWMVWEFAHDGYTTFDVFSWSAGKSTASSSGQGMTRIGDIVTISDDFFPQDSLLAQVYVATDYVFEGYITDTGQSGNVIPFEIQFGHSDLEIRENKRYHTAMIVAEAITAGSVNLSWSDVNNGNFGTPRVLNVDSTDPQTNRLGSARRRNFKITHSLTEQYRLAGIEVQVTKTTV